MRQSFMMFASILLLIGNTNGQSVKKTDDFNVRLSKPFQVVDGVSKQYLNSDDYVVAVKLQSKSNELILQSFDTRNLGEIAKNEIKLEGKDVYVEATTEFNNRFWLLYTEYAKSEEKENLYAVEIDPKTANIKMPGKLILSVSGKLSGDFIAGGLYGIGSRVTNKFSLEKSTLENKILVRYRKKPEKRNDDKSIEEIGFAVFDTEFNQIWSDERPMKYTESQLEIQDYSVDSEGNVYMILTVYPDGEKGKAAKGKSDNYFFELLRFSGANEPVETYKFNLENDKYLSSVLLKETDKKQMIMTGYYRKPDSKLTDGVYTVNITKDNVSFTPNYYPIPLDVLNLYETSRTSKKNEKKEADDDDVGMPDLKLNSLYTDDEGNSYLFGERSYVKSSTSTAQNSSRTTYVTYYCDILVTRINKDGQLAWMAKVPKNQRGAGRYIRRDMSYSILWDKNNINLLYIDNIKNLEIGTDARPKFHQSGMGGFLTSSSINIDRGTTTKKPVFDLRDVNGTEVFQFDTDRIVQINDNEIAVEVYKKGKEDVWVIVGAK